MKLILIDSFKTGFYLIQTLRNSYREKMNKVSSLMRDQMESPLERAVYWIEYVTRHDGAPHLRTASHKLSFIQRNLFDVLMFVFACSVLFLFLVFYIFRYFIFSIIGGVRIISDQKKTNWYK